MSLALILPRGVCVRVVVVVVVVFLTLTDPLRIQPWSQDRRNQTKSNRESEISMESRQKRTDKEVDSKGHRVWGAPICNTVLQHFSCNMVDAIRTTPHETLF